MRIQQHCKSRGALRGVVGGPLFGNIRLVLSSLSWVREQACPISCAIIVGSELAPASTLHQLSPQNVNPFEVPVIWSTKNTVNWLQHPHAWAENQACQGVNSPVHESGVKAS